MYNNYNPYLYGQYSQNIPQNVPQYTQSIPQKSMLQGKMVDNLEVVKGVEIPLDGSISYYPLADKSAIATKQLMTDGTSKVTIYKQIEEKEQPKVKYVTENDLNKAMTNFIGEDIEDIKEELKSLKKQIKGVK